MCQTTYTKRFQSKGGFKSKRSMFSTGLLQADDDINDLNIRLGFMIGFGKKDLKIPTNLLIPA